jgi:putative Mg2+ transporter-C (MgtC) family protein
MNAPMILQAMGDAEILIDLFGRAEAPLRLLLAGALGAAIGAERAHHGRSAGLRTQILVALGACLAMLVSTEFARVYQSTNPATNIKVDPARVAYGVMGGIGFLGAGLILRDRAGIRGITTAASLWATAAIGLACGLGMYGLAILTSALVVFALLALFRAGERLRLHEIRSLHVELRAGEGVSPETLAAILAEHGAQTRDVKYVRNLAEQVESITFRLHTDRKVSQGQLMEIISQQPGIRKVSIS